MRIVLELNGKRLDEICSDRETLTIGRDPENDVQIDNLAVSARHACIEKRGTGYVVRDLSSTNGTFVGGERVVDKALADGDAVTIGKHTLIFQANPNNGDAAPRSTPSKGAAGLRETMALETALQRELLNREEVSALKKKGWKLGVLRVVSGSTDRPEYELLSSFTMIGKDPGSGVRLKGLLDPNIAGYVERNEFGYSLVPPDTGNKLKLNGGAVKARTALAAGDSIDIRGVSLRFELRA